MDRKSKEPTESVAAAGGTLEFDGRRTVLLDAAGALYNLKKALRADIGFFEKDFMFRAGQEGAKECVSGRLEAAREGDAGDNVRSMLALLASRGYGEFKLDKLDESKRIIEISSKNAVEAWAFQANNDLQREPVCHYACGAISWICRTALSKGAPMDLDLGAVEVECVAQGARACRFVVAPPKELHGLLPKYDLPRESMSEHVLRLNEEILMKNLELQNLNLSLERQVRKRTEDLRRSEENYKALVNLTPDPVIICSLEGSIVSINEAGVRMLGCSSVDKALNLRIDALIGSGRSAWQKLVWLLEKEGRVDQFEMALSRLDGAKIVGEITARIADFQGGRVVEAIVRDVTEKKKMQAEVNEARTESDFLNDLMSHDITNYMISALHFSRKLRESGNLTEEERRMLGVIMKDLEGAFELSTAVRDLSMIKSIDTGGTRMVDLKRVLPEAAAEAAGMYSERKVRINIDMTGEPKFVKCTGLVNKLFVNLFTNCVKYDPSEEVVVDVTFDTLVDLGAAFWVVRVSDHGKGIPGPEKEKVFERFHRLDHSVQGTGLGLFVARFIASSCGGKIWAEDRVDGDHSKGTTVVVQLPKTEERMIAQSH